MPPSGYRLLKHSALPEFQLGDEAVLHRAFGLAWPTQFTVQCVHGKSGFARSDSS